MIIKTNSLLNGDTETGNITCAFCGKILRQGKNHKKIRRCTCLKAQLAWKRIAKMHDAL